eukprot:GILJ01006427.1.p1 GENE.GILJ01006427.1~~GILJ01006427.1.p1  ORF type:complete len:323 (+),score=34.43 GILJ01006427.1:50-1018(+)
MFCGPSGFYNAPVSKAIFFLVLILSITLGILKSSNNAALDFSVLSQGRQLWRILTASTIFGNVGDAIVGGVLLYQCRVFERLWGSNKFAAFALFVSLFTFMVQFVLLFSVPAWFPRFPSGPFGLIFAFLWNFHHDIPTVHPIQCAGISFSDKTLTYLLCLRLALSSTPASLVSATAGTIAGALYRSNGLPLKRLRFSSRMSAFASRVFLPLLSSPTIRRRSVSEARYAQVPQQDPDEQLMYEQHGQGYSDQLIPGHNWMAADHLNDPYSQRNFQQPVAPVQPLEQDIESLTAMGFDRQRVMQALRQCNNDVVAAAERLLSGH